VDLIHAFVRGIKDSRLETQIISDFGHIGKIVQIIENLEHLSGHQQISLDDTSLDTNVKDWVIGLINNYPKVDENLMRFLLQDFTDSMKTRMREVTKYVIGLLTADRLLLCHSIYGGETITPKWDIIPRMLDTDNVLRHVSFSKNEGVISLEFWEKDYTQSFMEWLGLKRKMGFQFGGIYRIRSEMASMTIELQLDETQIEDLIGMHPEFIKNQISLSSPINILNIDEIKYGTKHYENSEQFLQIYQAEKFGLQPYAEKYEKLKKSIYPVVIQYIDDEQKVISIDRGQENVEVQKDIQGIEILFVNEYIDLAVSYQNKLVTKFINNDPMKVFHAGCQFSTHPYQLKNMEILNKLKMDELTLVMTEFYNSVKLLDKTVDNIIKYSILASLARVNFELPITHFFNKLAQRILSSMEIEETKWVKGEDKVLEYKASDFLIGNNKEIVAKLANDIKTKIKDSPFKIYIVGAEDDGTINPMNSSRLPNDRVEKIKSGLQHELKNKELQVCRIVEDDKCFLIIAILSHSSQTTKVSI
jgi:hypothetical protein